MTSMPPDILVQFENVRVDRGGRRVLWDVDLELARGEIVTVVGPNGSGKTTLIRTLLGALAPSSGRVRRRGGLRIGYVPQKLALDAGLPLSVERFLSLGRRGPAALDRVGLGDLAGQPLAALSGGQLQRVLLAGAIADAPDLLALDEPTQGLDQAGSAAFYRLVEDIRAETGAAVLMVSHDLHVVMSATDRVICLNGHVCCEGLPDVVQRAPEYRALFGTQTQGALALYRHDHDHVHGPAGPHG